jgi:hypothetical protein
VPYSQCGVIRPNFASVAGRLDVGELVYVVVSPR